MIMNRIGIFGIFILTLAVMSPKAAFADWKVYFTGKMASMFGSAGRGSYATQPQCEAARSSLAPAEARNSYCGGFSTPSQTTSSGDDGAAAREQEKQRQLQLQRAQEERELEIARQKKFAEEKRKLLGTFKGSSTGTGTLGLKGSGTGTPGLKTLSGNSTRDSAPVDPMILQEQDEFKKNNTAWMENQKKLIRRRLEEPNRWSGAAYTSLKTNAPPLPYKKFDELQAGDVLLLEGSKFINKPDQYLSGNKVSNASHTVIYLKEINGTKIFLDNQPGEGPRIIPEEYFLKKYGHRGAEVARLAQPLNKEEAERLYAAAKEMRARNLEKIQANNWFDKTTYGAWGKENVVCSEADWVLIKAAGREIPKSDDRIKNFLGVGFSPADYPNHEQYFFVSPLAMPN